MGLSVLKLHKIKMIKKSFDVVQSTMKYLYMTEYSENKFNLVIQM